MSTGLVTLLQAAEYLERRERGNVKCKLNNSFSNTNNSCEFTLPRQHHLSVSIVLSDPDPSYYPYINPFR